MSAVALLEDRFVAVIAQEIGCRKQQVIAAAELFAEGATVPFVARYRKEATGGLDDQQLEDLHKRRAYFLDLAARRDAILGSIAEQGKLSPELEAAIRTSLSKQELEDLYLPYRPKRRTRAQISSHDCRCPVSKYACISSPMSPTVRTSAKCERSAPGSRPT